MNLTSPFRRVLVRSSLTGSILFAIAAFLFLPFAFADGGVITDKPTYTIGVDTQVKVGYPSGGDGCNLYLYRASAPSGNGELHSCSPIAHSTLGTDLEQDFSVTSTLMSVADTYTFVLAYDGGDCTSYTLDDCRSFDFGYTGSATFDLVADSCPVVASTGKSPYLALGLLGGGFIGSTIMNRKKDD